MDQDPSTSKRKCEDNGSPVEKKCHAQYESEDDMDQVANDKKVGIAGKIKDEKQKYRFLTIEVDDTEIDRDDYFDYIVVNGEEVRISLNVNEDEFHNLMSYINKTLGVRIRTLELKGLYKLDRKYHNMIHDILLNVLIGFDDVDLIEFVGIEDLCMGCSDCTELAKECRRYGPVQSHFAASEGLNEVKPFTELIVSDLYIFNIAEHATINDEDKIDLDDLGELIPPVKCKNLVITLTEKEVKEINPEEDIIYSPPSLPIEVINQIMKRWEVKSVRLEFYAPTGNRVIMSEYYNFHNFDHISFDCFVSPSKKFEDLGLSHLDIDLTHSIEFARAFTKNGQRHGNDNLIDTARKFFLIDFITVILPKGFMDLESTRKNLHGAVAATWKEKQHPLQLELRMFPNIPLKPMTRGLLHLLHIRSNWIEIETTDVQISETHYKVIGLNSNSRKVFGMVQYTGGRVILTNTKEKSVINVDIRVEKEAFENYFHTLERIFPNKKHLHFLQILLNPIHRACCEKCRVLLKDIPMPEAPKPYVLRL